LGAPDCAWRLGNAYAGALRFNIGQHLQVGQPIRGPLAFGHERGAVLGLIVNRLNGGPRTSRSGLHTAGRLARRRALWRSATSAVGEVRKRCKNLMDSLHQRFCAGK
jgi:hypothetical protein